MSLRHYRTTFILMLIFSAGCISSQVKKHGDGLVIRPGETWLDNNGHHIQAHGGGIIKTGNLFYWYGEDRGEGLDSTMRFVSCYHARDLVNWTRDSDALALADPEQLGSHWVLERPKVYHNPATGKYVMYLHIDNASYKLAEVAVAVADNPTGPFHYVKKFRPLGHESRDIGQFIDDDGTAYLVFEDRPFGFRIALLSPDYMNVEKEMSLVPKHMEGGAIVHYDGLYYAIGSALTGWKANPNKYATATSLSGPWSDFKDITAPENNTYGAQSTMMIKYSGRDSTTVIFMGDIWRPKTQWDSRYLWMPLQIGGGQLKLPEPRPWIPELKSGRWAPATRL
jgi:hypothetical protein